MSLCSLQGTSFCLQTDCQSDDFCLHLLKEQLTLCELKEGLHFSQYSWKMGGYFTIVRSTCFFFNGKQWFLMVKMTRYPGLSGAVLVYSYCPNILFNDHSSSLSVFSFGQYIIWSFYVWVTFWGIWSTLQGKIHLSSWKEAASSWFCLKRFRDTWTKLFLSPTFFGSYYLKSAGMLWYNI